MGVGMGSIEVGWKVFVGVLVNVIVFFYDYL